MKKEDKLKELAELTGEKFDESIEVTEKIENIKVKVEEPTAIDGFRFVKTSDLPFYGVLYPKSWNFFYRCPTVDEVANFSTVSDDDNAKMVSTIESLIKKCWQIIDSESQANISTSEINDGDRLFFFLKLREYYLHDSPIQYNIYNAEHFKSITIDLLAESLVYDELKPSLIEKYDGRMLTISVPDREETIKFLCPTFEISRKILLYMQKTQKNIREKNVTKKDDINRTFILFLPYLFESGKESMERLEIKLKNIMKDRVLFDRYMAIIGTLSLTNKDKISYRFNDEYFESGLEFPSFNRMFIKQNLDNKVEDDI